MIHFGENSKSVRQLLALSNNYGIVFYSVHLVTAVKLDCLKLSYLNIWLYSKDRSMLLFLLYILGRTWFSSSLYSFTPNRQNRNQVHWNTCAGSIFRGGVDKTVKWPVHKQDGRALPSLYQDIFLPFQIGSDNDLNWKNMVVSKRDWRECILSFFFLLLGNQIVLLFHNSINNRLIYSRVLQSAQFCLFKMTVLAYFVYSKIAKWSSP